MIKPPGKLTKSEGKRQMNIMLPTSTYNRMIDRRYENGETLADICRRGVEMYLQSVEQQPEKQSAV